MKYSSDITREQFNSRRAYEKSEEPLTSMAIVDAQSVKNTDTLTVACIY
jgi:hypothetical protein